MYLAQFDIFYSIEMRYISGVLLYFLALIEITRIEMIICVKKFDE